MTNVITLHKLTILLIKRARENKSYPLDIFLAQYGLRAPLVSLIGYLMFLTFKVFIWGVSCENPIIFNDVPVPNLILSISGTFISLMYTDLFMKRYLYANIYDLIAILPLNLIQRIFLKYSVEIFGYRLIFIVIDMGVLTIFLYTYFPNLSLVLFLQYYVSVFLTHYLAFGSYSLLFNYFIKIFNFSKKAVTSLNNYFLSTLLIIVLSLFYYSNPTSRIPTFSVNSVLQICFCFVLVNLVLCIIFESFFDNNLYTNDNN